MRANAERFFLTNGASTGLRRGAPSAFGRYAKVRFLAPKLYTMRNLRRLYI